MPRFHCPVALASGDSLALPAGAARHVQVLRLQPGSPLLLFNGEGGEFEATVTQMGRSEVTVQIGAHLAVEREAPRAIHLAIGMPANERMDWLVEKATELGVASIQPLLAERSVLRLAGERAVKKQAHWQGIAIAAAEQCGRNRVPAVHAPADLAAWCAASARDTVRLVLSLDAAAQPLRGFAGQGAVTVLSGPEGGLSPQEEKLALAQDFVPVTLGPRVLRAETAPLVVLAALGLA
ncbi:MAG: 16S rRNA (uracil(1498)-N(3))-methyltransferase [Comamonadaceae bacterium]|nr:MAG: 16S rRNA (uracil(1498)-N(3))-methyltransferase [Comamonadaceae bacterium]